MGTRTKLQTGGADFDVVAPKLKHDDEGEQHRQPRHPLCRKEFSFRNHDDLHRVPPRPKDTRRKNKMYLSVDRSNRERLRPPRIRLGYRMIKAGFSKIPAKNNLFYVLITFRATEAHTIIKSTRRIKSRILRPFSPPAQRDNVVLFIITHFSLSGNKMDGKNGTFFSAG